MHNNPIEVVSQLRDLIRTYPTPAAFMQTELNYNDEDRAATLVGVIEYVLNVQQDHDGQNEEERLRQWADWARPGDYLAVGVKGFALAGFQYLRMLFGAKTTKPDVHIMKYVSRAVGRDVTDVQALYLLERAAKIADLPLHHLDVAIWTGSARAGQDL